MPRSPGPVVLVAVKTATNTDGADITEKQYKGVQSRRSRSRSGSQNPPSQQQCISPMDKLYAMMEASMAMQREADRRAQQQSERLELVEKALVLRTSVSQGGLATSSAAVGTVVERQTDSVQHGVNPNSTDGSAVLVSMAPSDVVTGHDVSASDSNTQEDQFEDVEPQHEERCSSVHSFTPSGSENGSSSRSCTPPPPMQGQGKRKAPRCKHRMKTVSRVTESSYDSHLRLRHQSFLLPLIRVL